VRSNHALDRTRGTDANGESKDALSAVACDRSDTARRSAPSLGSTGQRGLKMTRLVLNLALLALVPVLALQSSKSAADATLSNFDSQHRAPGSFYVIFKTPAELAAMPRTGPKAPKVLSQVVPTSKDAVWRLAAALCAQIHAQLAGINYVPSHAAFITRGASDAAMREVLGKDPRIAEISANIEILPLN
jgi:hypothetical protein